MTDETQREIAEWLATVPVPVSERQIMQRWGLTQYGTRKRCQELERAGAIRRPDGMKRRWEAAA